MPEETVAMTLGLSFTFIVVIIFISVFVVIIKKTRNQKTQNEYAERYRANNSTANTSKQNTLTDAQRMRLEELREYHKQRIAADERDIHQIDADEHEHIGEEEHYEEIVGSLGEVNDEGCVDLSGVRFIAHDIAYETGESDHADYSKVAQSMVLGDILNNPRFKKPYSRK